MTIDNFQLTVGGAGAPWWKGGWEPTPRAVAELTEVASQGDPATLERHARRQAAKVLRRLLRVF